jgi:hypothetical protein
VKESGERTVRIVGSQGDLQEHRRVVEEALACEPVGGRGAVRHYRRAKGGRGREVEDGRQRREGREGKVEARMQMQGCFARGAAAAPVHARRLMLWQLLQCRHVHSRHEGFKLGRGERGWLVVDVAL